MPRLLALCALLAAASATLTVAVQAQTPPAADPAAMTVPPTAWRAYSRFGYGPGPSDSPAVSEIGRAHV